MTLAWFALSAVALGHALQIKNGFYDPTAIRWLTLSIALCAAGVASLRLARPVPRPASLAIALVLAAAIGWQLEAALTKAPGFYVNPEAPLWLFRTGIGLEATLVGLALTGARVARRWFGAVLVVHAVLGVWMLVASPNPWIDVVTVHRAALDALLHHRDPYRIALDNIYGPLASHFYNPAAIVGNKIAIGYPYPPLSLLLAVPGHVLAGDYRYAELAAVIGAAALIGWSREGLDTKLAACLFLTTPRGLFVLEQGWTEPVAVLLLAATVFLMLRSPTAASWAAGLLLVVKQYLGLAGPAFLKFVVGRQRRWPLLLLWAGLAAAVVTLPLALWHPNAFLNNVVWLQLKEPFRMDSLSYLSWAARAGFGKGSFAWAIGGGLLALAVAMIITPNTPAGFAAAVAFCCLVTFAFGSKAFCNYYFFVIGALCSAAAAAGSGPVWLDKAAPG